MIAEPRRITHARAAFTLLEVLVGLTVNIIVLTSVIAVFSFAQNEQRLERVRSQLGREGAALGQLLSNEVRIAGLGRPTGREVDVAGDVPLSFLVAQQRSLGFIADVQRPDANFATFGILNDRPSGVGNVMFHTDNNGICAPSTSGSSCSTADTSVLFPGEGGCAAAGAGTDRTCAWGSKRLRPGEHLQIVGGNGSYYRGLVDSLNLVVGTGTGSAGTLALRLSPSRPFPLTWPNNVVGDAPTDIRGQGWVTTIDRVFYRYVPEARRMERRQCFGDMLVGDASWPAASVATNANTLLDGGLDISAVPGQVCTAWELMARDVIFVEFRYFDVVGSQLVNATSVLQRQAITRVEWVIRLARAVGGRNVIHELVGSVRLRNGG